MSVVKGFWKGWWRSVVSSSHKAERPHRPSSPLFITYPSPQLRAAQHPENHLLPAGHEYGAPEYMPTSLETARAFRYPWARSLGMSLQDATPKPPSYPIDLENSMVLPKRRASPASSLASLPYRRSNPSLHKLFESTTSISGSRPSSGSATPTASTIPSSVFSPGSRQNGTGTPGGLPPGASDEHRHLIQRAFQCLTLWYWQILRPSS